MKTTAINLTPAQQDYVSKFKLFTVAASHDGVTVYVYDYDHKLYAYTVDANGKQLHSHDYRYSEADLRVRQTMLDNIIAGDTEAVSDLESLLSL